MADSCITIETAHGNYKSTLSWLEKLLGFNDDLERLIEAVGHAGVDALRSGTPVDTGLAMSSWGFTTTRSPRLIQIGWHNYDIEGGYNVAILVQYGHGTGTGGYVKGRDFINPAMQPLFDKFAADIYKEVSSI